MLRDASLLSMRMLVNPHPEEACKAVSKDDVSKNQSPSAAA